MLPNIGANLLREDEIGDILEDHGFVSVRTKNFGTLHGCGPNADNTHRARLPMLSSGHG
jgi:hypothetical protein